MDGPVKSEEGARTELKPVPEAAVARPVGRHVAQNRGLSTPAVGGRQTTFLQALRPRTRC